MKSKSKHFIILLFRFDYWMTLFLIDVVYSSSLSMALSFPDLRKFSLTTIFS